MCRPGATASGRYAIDLVLGESGWVWTTRSRPGRCRRCASPARAVPAPTRCVSPTRLFGRVDTDWSGPRWLPGGPLDGCDTADAGIGAVLVHPTVAVLCGQRLANGSYVD